MLKITKGLKPYVEEGVSIYTDGEGRKYARVKTDDMDFCIAAHDFTEDRRIFSWDDAMESLKDNGLTTFTKNQAEQCKAYYNEINNNLKKIGGDTFKDGWFWTITEHGDDEAGVFYGDVNDLCIYDSLKNNLYSVRTIINL